MDSANKENWKEVQRIFVETKVKWKTKQILKYICNYYCLKNNFFKTLKHFQNCPARIP